MHLNQNSTYNIVTNHEVSTVLSRLSSDEIIDTIKTINSNKYRYYTGMASSSNIVNSYEIYCKNCKLTYPNQSNEIMNTRNETLTDIIDTLLKLYNLSWIAADNTEDIYSIAFYLYDLLIDNFNNYIIGFFIRYTTREKYGISNMLENMGIAVNNKKIKDLSTIYSKSIYNHDEDNKMAYIHSNMDIVLSNIISFDITFEQFIADAYAYYNIPHIGRLITQMVGDVNGTFFNNFIKPYVLIFLPQLVTDIKLNAQSINTIDIASLLKSSEEELENVGEI